MLLPIIFFKSYNDLLQVVCYNIGNQILIMEKNRRLQTSLKKEVAEKLNRQVKMEEASSQFYLSCASWCHTKGYEKAADFLYKHADEERMHMLKIFKYINDAGGHALVPEIADIRHDFSSLREIFENVLEHEVEVTKAINDLIDMCFQQKDFMTYHFLEWFISEQREEEELARRILEIFDIIGEEGQGLWLIDQELGKLATIADAGTAE